MPSDQPPSDQPVSSDENRPLLRTLNPNVLPERRWSRRRKLLVFGGPALAAVIVIAVVVMWLTTPKHYADAQGSVRFDYATRLERVPDQELVSSPKDVLSHVVFEDTGNRGDEGETGYFNGFSVTVYELPRVLARMSTSKLLDAYGRSMAADLESNVLRTEGPREMTLNDMPCLYFATERNFEGEHWWFETYVVPGTRTVLYFALQVRDIDRSDERTVLLRPSSSLVYADARSLTVE